MAISPQWLTIYLYSAHRAVIFAIAQLSCYYFQATSGGLSCSPLNLAARELSYRVISHYGLPSRILTCTELKGNWLCLF